MVDMTGATLRTERRLAANRKRVFAAFSDPDRLARWWGTAGFGNTFETFEFWEGGRWAFVMHGPNGGDYTNECIFRVIEPEQKIVIEHVVKPWYRLTVTLADDGEGTRLIWEQTFESAEFAERMRPICEPANEQNLDRLEKEVGIT